MSKQSKAAAESGKGKTLLLAGLAFLVIIGAALVGVLVGRGDGMGDLLSIGQGGASSDAPLEAACKEGSPVKAVVGGQPVADSDLDIEQLIQELLYARQGRTLESDGLPSFRRELLNQLVDQMVLYSQTQSETPLDAATLNAEVNQLLGGFGLSIEQVQAAAQERGISQQAVDRWARRNLANSRYAQRSARSPEDLAASFEPQTEIQLCFDGEAVMPAKVGEMAPDFELENLAGGTTSLESLRGKGVLVNFWATWCGPCKIEMPVFIRAHNTHPNDLVVLGIDVEEQRGIVQTYVDNNQIVFPIVLDEAGRVSATYRVKALPTSYFVDPSGRIVDMHRGAIRDPFQLEDYLQRILPASAASRIQLPGLLDRG